MKNVALFGSIEIALKWYKKKQKKYLICLFIILYEHNQANKTNIDSVWIICLFFSDI